MEIHGNDEQLKEIIARLIPDFAGDRVIILRVKTLRTKTPVIERIDVGCATSCDSPEELYMALLGAAEGIKEQFKIRVSQKSEN